MEGPAVLLRNVCSCAAKRVGCNTRPPKTKTPRSAPPIRIDASLMRASLRGERALRNLPPGAANPRLSVAITGRHTLLGEALAKLIAARLRIGMNRPVAGDIEHRAN